MTTVMIIMIKTVISLSLFFQALPCYFPTNFNKINSFTYINYYLLSALKFKSKQLLRWNWPKCLGTCFLLFFLGWGGCYTICLQNDSSITVMKWNNCRFLDLCNELKNCLTDAYITPTMWIDKQTEGKCNVIEA